MLENVEWNEEKSGQDRAVWNTKRIVLLKRAAWVSHNNEATWIRGLKEVKGFNVTGKTSLWVLEVVRPGEVKGKDEGRAYGL